MGGRPGSGPWETLVPYILSRVRVIGKHWAILGPFGAILGHFGAILGSERGSPGEVLFEG